MFTVQINKFSFPKRHTVIVLSDGNKAAQVAVIPDDQILCVSGLHGYGTEFYPKSKDELAENILSAYEENGHKPGSETIKGKTFDDMGDAVLYIQDMLQIEVKDVTKQYLSDIDDNIADIKQDLNELEEKKNKALSYISKFVDAV